MASSVDRPYTKIVSSDVKLQVGSIIFINILVTLIRSIC